MKFYKNIKGSRPTRPSNREAAGRATPAHKAAGFFRLSAFLLAASLLLLSAAPCYAAADTPRLRFACMSDLHLDDVIIYSSHSNTDQFQTALDTAAAKGYTDLFICGGDMSSYGRTSVWEKVRTMINGAGFKKTLYALGNHEYGTVIENPDGDRDFMDFTGKDSIYYDEVFAGYHFIVLGCEDTDLSEQYFSDEQAAWFADTLAAAVADTPDQPVFVISHYPESYSAIGSRIGSYLKQYENVFFFWGHSHSESWEDYDITGYQSLKPGHVSSRMGSVQYGTANIADVLLVDVYENRVSLTIERTDGAALPIKTTTVYLSNSVPGCTVSRLASYNGSTELSLRLSQPCDTAAQLYLAYYDENGRFCGCEQCVPTVSGDTAVSQLSAMPENCHRIRLFLTDGSSRPITSVLSW